MSAAYILVAITYIGGSAWGPLTSMQEFSSKSACENGKQTIISMVDDLNKTNLAGGKTHSRELIKTECVKK